MFDISTPTSPQAIHECALAEKARLTTQICHPAADSRRQRRGPVRDPLPARWPAAHASARRQGRACSALSSSLIALRTATATRRRRPARSSRPARTRASSTCRARRTSSASSTRSARPGRRTAPARLSACPVRLRGVAPLTHLQTPSFSRSSSSPTARSSPNSGSVRPSVRARLMKQRTASLRSRRTTCSTTSSARRVASERATLTRLVRVVGDRADARRTAR